MKAIVLAGGYATRLRPISYALPKLLFPVLGKPMIYWTLDVLKSHGIDEVVLAVNYLANTLRARVGEEYRGIRIHYSLEDRPLGTGGPLRLASQKIRLRDTFIATNGDVIAEIDLTQMLERHRGAKAAVTDALHEERDPTRFGVAQLDSNMRISRFVEKPSLKEAPGKMVNAGIYMIEPSVLRMIPAGRRVSLEREIFPILARRRRLIGFPFNGHWFDIGSLSDFKKANLALLQNEKSKHIITQSSRWLDADLRNVAPSLLGKHSTVERTARVGPSTLLGKNCHIASGARVTNSILFDEVTVGKDSIVSGAIVASNVSIGKRVRIEPGTVISPNVRVIDGVKIRRNAILHPYKEITMNVAAGKHVM
jgi:mannose-1-phosphate guanylyltransferase